MTDSVCGAYLQEADKHNGRHSVDSIDYMVQEMCTCFERGNKILVCGNGGSAAQASHFAAELVGRFQLYNRPPLPVMSLNTDTSIITAVGNDICFDAVFSTQVRAHAKAQDILLIISTSGKSKNVRNAAVVARGLGTRVFALTSAVCDYFESDIHWRAFSEVTCHAQEETLVVLHALCYGIEQTMASSEKGTNDMGRL